MLPHYRRSEGYNEFLRPLGFDHMLWVGFSDGDTPVGWYPLWRSENMKPFGHEDVQFMSLAAPHIAHGLKVAQLTEASALVSAEDFLPEPSRPAGTVILSADGAITAADSGAEAISLETAMFDRLNASTGGTISRGELFAYMAKTVKAAFGDELSSRPPVLRLYSDRTGITLKLRGFMARRSAGRQYIVVLIERGWLRQHVRARIALRLGLSSTDIQLLDGLRGGLRNAEIAARMRIARGTLKAYMRRLVDKLGAHCGIEALRRFAHDSWL